MKIGDKVTAFQADGTAYVIGVLLQSVTNPVSRKTMHHIQTDSDSRLFITSARIAPWAGESVAPVRTVYRYDRVSRYVSLGEIRGKLAAYDEVYVNGTRVTDAVTEEQLVALQKVATNPSRGGSYMARMPMPKTRPLVRMPKIAPQPISAPVTLQEIFDEVNVEIGDLD